MFDPLEYQLINMIDLLKLDYSQLRELGQQVAQQISVAEKQELKRAAEQIEEIAKSLNMRAASKTKCNTFAVRCCHAENLYSSDDTGTSCLDDHARRPVQCSSHC